MALKITDNFNYTGRKPNFQRDQFATTSEMNAYTVCDEGHISYNLLDNKHYSFKNGAWSVLQTGGGGSSYTHPSSHPASIITYDSSETYESGNVGYEIKQLVTSLAAKYVKPNTGIPKADLANDVLTSLGYADDYNTNKSSFLTSTALETALEGLSPYSAGAGISITTVSGGKLIAIDSSVYKVKDILNASGTSLVNNGIATIPNATITSIKDSGGNDLTITNGVVTLPAIPTVPITQINKSDNTQLSPISGVVTLPAIPTNASDILFDDSLTHLGAQQDPVDNVQKAINMLTTAIVSGNCILSVNLKDYDGTDIASEYIGLSYVLNGNTVVLSDLSDTTPAISTDSNGIAHAVIPYGAQYTIVFNTRSNRQAIPSYTNTADTNHINLFRYYNKEADKELVIVQVMVKNANNADLDNYSLQNKEVYIDYLNNQGTVVTEAAITCYLNVQGRINTWQESGSNTVHTYSEDPIYINKGQYYRVRLQEWSPALSSDEQELIKSENKSRLAQDYTKSFQMFYTYKKAGIFFVVEDYDGDTDLNTYTEYLCEDYDDTEHTITIVDNETSNRYILKYDASEGGIVRALSTDPTNFILWISTSNMNRVLGIGMRTSDTINNDLEYTAYESYGYVDCSFLIPRNVALVVKKMQDTASNWASLPKIKSGKAVTVFMAESTAPYCEMADYITTNLSLKTGNLTQEPFIPSPLQARVMANNKLFIKNALLVLNNTLFNNVNYTITVNQASAVSFEFVNIYGTSGTPINKLNNQSAIPLYCF